MASTLFLAFALLLCSLRQAGAQSFVRPANNPAAAGLGPNEGATGDFNNDGYPDMIVASATTGIVGILVNDGTGTLVRLATNIATLPCLGRSPLPTSIWTATSTS